MVHYARGSQTAYHDGDHVRAKELHDKGKALQQDMDSINLKVRHYLKWRQRMMLHAEPGMRYRQVN